MLSLRPTSAALLLVAVTVAAGCSSTRAGSGTRGSGPPSSSTGPTIFADPAGPPIETSRHAVEAYLAAVQAKNVAAAGELVCDPSGWKQRARQAGGDLAAPLTGYTFVDGKQTTEFAESRVTYLLQPGNVKRDYTVRLAEAGVCIDR